MLKRTVAPLGCALVMFVVFLSSTSVEAETLEARGVTGGAGETLCVDVDGSRAQDGTALILYRCHGGQNQRFSYLPKSGEIRSALGSGNFCVDVDKGAA